MQQHHGISSNDEPDLDVVPSSTKLDAERVVLNDTTSPTTCTTTAPGGVPLPPTTATTAPPPLNVQEDEQLDEEDENPTFVSDVSAVVSSYNPGEEDEDDDEEEEDDVEEDELDGNESSSCFSLCGVKRVAPSPPSHKKRRMTFTDDSSIGYPLGADKEVSNTSSSSSSVMEFPPQALPPALTPAEKHLDSLPEPWAAEIRRVRSVRGRAAAEDPTLLLDVPAPADNELEWVVECFLLREFIALNRVWSPAKVYRQTIFRLMLFPTGNRNNAQAMSCYLALDPSASLPEDFRPFWRMQRAPFSIIVYSWRDWRRKSLPRNESFSFTHDNPDRGWEELLTKAKCTSQDMLGPRGQLLLRGQLCPKPVECVLPSVPRGSSSNGPRLPYVGLRNHGATCYLNALMQTLFHVGAFRSAVFVMTRNDDRAAVAALAKETSLVEENATVRSEEEATKILQEDPPFTNGEGDDSISLVTALQNLFIELGQAGAEPAATQPLLHSFGWGIDEFLTQHDAQELNRLLSDRLEARMKGGPSDGSLRRLFAGEYENFIECVDVEFASVRKEEFYDLQLDVQGCESLESSLRQYISAEMLEGENAYFAEGHGKQRARKGVRFLSFPPVLQFHLKRFTFDPTYMSMIKVNQLFTYPERLDCDQFVKGSGTYVLFGVIVHAGDVSGGHYYAFVRPGGGKYWWKFDDECVTPVSPYSALADCYGGNEPRCRSVERTPQGLQTCRLHSAYMLFYVREDLEKKLLPAPDLKTINPHLERRRELEGRRHQRREAAEEWLRSHVHVRYVTEGTLCGLAAQRDAEVNWSELPAAYEETRSANMEMPDLLSRVRNMAAKGDFGPILQQQAARLGLWYVNLAVRHGGLSVAPVDLARADQKIARYYTLTDHYDWAKESRRRLSPSEQRRVLVLLVRPLMVPPAMLRCDTGCEEEVMECQRIAALKLFVPTLEASPPRLMGFISLNMDALQQCFEDFIYGVWRRDTVERLFPEARDLTADQLLSAVPAGLHVEQQVVRHTGPGGLHVEQQVVRHIGKQLQSELEKLIYAKAGESWRSPVLVLATPPSAKVAKAAEEAQQLCDQLQRETAVSQGLPLDESSTRRLEPAVCDDGQDEQEDDHGDKKGLRKQHSAQPHLCLADCGADTVLLTDCIAAHQRDAVIACLRRRGYDDREFPPLVVPGRLHPPLMPTLIPVTLTEWSQAQHAFVKLELRLYNPLAALARWESAACQPLPLEDAPTCDKASDETPVEFKMETRLERCPPLRTVELLVDLRWPLGPALQRMAWEVDIEPHFCALSDQPPLLNRSSPVIPLGAPGRKTPVDHAATVMFPLAEAPTFGMEGLLALFGPRDSLSEEPLEMLYYSIGRAQGRGAAAGSGVVFHLCALPRIGLRLNFGFRVLNRRADSVGLLQLQVVDIKKATVQGVISELEKLLTPAMRERGLSDVSSWRLSCAGMPAQPINERAIHLPVRPTSLELIESDDALRLTLGQLREWQLDTPLRLEPNWTPKEQAAIAAVESNMIVTVLHRNKDREYFGHPFMVVAERNATVHNLKQAVQQKLELTDCQMQKIKFLIVQGGRPAFVKDHEQPFARATEDFGVMVAMSQNPYAGEDILLRSQQLVIRE